MSCPSTVRLSPTTTQRAKIAEKVHKPPLVVNVINFELNGFNASIWVTWSPLESKNLQFNDRSIQIHKISVITSQNSLVFLRFVNLFVEVSRVCDTPVVHMKYY